MQLLARSAEQRRAHVEGAGKVTDRPAVDVGGDASGLFQKQETGRGVENPDRDRRAENIERATGGVRHRQSHRTEYADLARPLQQRSEHRKPTRRALEADELKTRSDLAGLRGQPLAATPRAMLAD